VAVVAIIFRLYRTHVLDGSGDGTAIARLADAANATARSSAMEISAQQFGPGVKA
jgi:hypothetical protein